MPLVIYGLGDEHTGRPILTGIQHKNDCRYVPACCVPNIKILLFRPSKELLCTMIV